MRRGPALLALATGAALALAGCDGAEPGPPDRTPDVTGRVDGVDRGPGPVLSDASDPYFEGMWLLRADPLIVDAAGTPLDPAALRAGRTVEVWIEGACAESFPVQCDVVALRVR